MAANLYSYAFSCDVVEKFIGRRGRAWSELTRIYPALESDQIVDIFRKDQHRWYIFKKILKLIGRLQESPRGFSQAFIEQRVLTSVKYFRAYEKKIIAYGWDPGQSTLDRHDLFSLEY